MKINLNSQRKTLVYVFKVSACPFKKALKFIVTNESNLNICSAFNF